MNTLYKLYYIYHVTKGNLKVRIGFLNKHVSATWKQVKWTFPLQIAQGNTDTGMWISTAPHLQQRPFNRGFEWNWSS